jgi:hypothetical protein
MLQTPGAVIQTNTKFNPSDEWHRFTLASFALGTNGLDSYFFEGSGTDNSDAPDVYQADAAALGSFTGPMVKHGGVYVRMFANGEAVVNPGTTTLTVTFPKPLINLDGKRVASEVLGPQTGDLLHG